MSKFIYVMDPMCSWCWAFSPELERLQSQYPEISTTYLMGGLAPDSLEAMPMDMQRGIRSIWSSIEKRTGVKFNHNFWEKCKPRRSTYPACRAVICSEQLRPSSSAQMISAIQNAYYQEALNPSDDDVLVNLAIKMGFNEQLFRKGMNTPETQAELNTQIKEGQHLGAQGFPALFLQQGTRIEPISLGYTNENRMISRVEEILDQKK